ncbi:ribbon-helix-helix domain-containing protein [Caulobacter sp. UNC279MFTsu5.1]|uniref:ribbon-helix-helix domain-containing protein n=1 Tax=Caulobacter sp. UNC279MFTsu5.1 TaxID=1502775 RepID=UPI00037200CE|nr:ribbon-helix-helix domain-containing protein [Caulobacter sp. UNC279MFTsu5.1]SFK75270.1 Ribbon-helix-helix protein, copG family [Caulobacter sp. UNC279MFTsu5.1]
MKVETKVYLPADLAKALDQLAIRTRRPKSEIVRAALASFMSPDGAERTEAALLRRLDRMNKHMERVEREAQVGNEALAIFIRTWLGATPVVSAADEAATRALGQKRYGAFIQALNRRLTSGASLSDQGFEPGEHGFDADETGGR